MFGPYVLLLGLGIAAFFTWVQHNADREERLKELDRQSLNKRS